MVERPETTKLLTGASVGGKRAPRVCERHEERRLAKTDLGEKQVCPSCGAKFYDLRRRPATCPKCTTSFDPAEESARSRRGRSRVAAHENTYEDDDEEAKAKIKAKTGAEDEDEDEAEVEVTPEVDIEADVEPVVTDEDEEVAATGEELPEGFSEEEADLGEDAADDDAVPMIEDEEEFPEDAIGELPSGEDDDGGR